MGAPFVQVTLRTSDADRARAFYESVLGPRALSVFPLHEQAVARGARPHWLGFIDVADVDRASATFLAAGATALAPKWVSPEGLEAAVMRDPCGAIVALARPPGDSRARAAAAARFSADVGWILLHATDVERAKSSYREVTGWELAPPFELGSFGVFHPFALEPGRPPVGSMCDVAGRPGAHPHWLYYMRVTALDPALEAVRAGGGTVLGPFTLPAGERIAVCDDPQGAAFGLREEPVRAAP